MDIFKTLNLDFKNLGFFQKVISLNILVFLIYIILRLFDFEYILINNFSLNSDLLTRPWSLVTYSFLHEGLFDLIFMVILLTFTTNSISNLLGEKICINLFLSGIFLGGIIFLFFTDSDTVLIGASAGISSLLIFLFLISPDLGFKFFNYQIKFKYIMIIIFFIDFLRLISPSEYGVYSHFGGYLGGVFYYLSLYGFPKSNKKKFNSNNRTNKNYKLKKQQSKVDKILDKISKSGYDNLSDNEKEFLFKQGKNK